VEDAKILKAREQDLSTIDKLKSALRGQAANEEKSSAIKLKTFEALSHRSRNGLVLEVPPSQLDLEINKLATVQLEHIEAMSLFQNEAETSKQEIVTLNKKLKEAQATSILAERDVELAKMRAGQAIAANELVVNKANLDTESATQRANAANDIALERLELEHQTALEHTKAGNDAEIKRALAAKNLELEQAQTEVATHKAAAARIAAEAQTSIEEVSTDANASILRVKQELEQALLGACLCDLQAVLVFVTGFCSFPVPLSFPAFAPLETLPLCDPIPCLMGRASLLLIHEAGDPVIYNQTLTV
jgi:hypothetical protein